MAKDARSLPRPMFDRAITEYCSKRGGNKTPHLKMALPPATYESSHCLVCNPHLLDAPDNGKHPYEMLDRFEARRLIHMRDKNLGAGLRVYLKGDGATTVEALVAHFARGGAA